jgi:hypothetical protein
MLTIIPINPYKAKSTGNLDIKGIPTKSTRCPIKEWNYKINKMEQCIRRANFLVCNTKPTFKFMELSPGRPYRFAGMANTLTFYCALHTLKQIDFYKDKLESRIRDLDRGYSNYGISGRERTPRAKKMLKTQATNELSRIDNLILSVHRLMKKDKNIAADLIEV